MNLDVWRRRTELIRERRHIHIGICLLYGLDSLVEIPEYLVRTEIDIALAGYAPVAERNVGLARIAFAESLIVGLLETPTIEHTSEFPLHVLELLRDLHNRRLTDNLCSVHV